MGGVADLLAFQLFSIYFDCNGMKMKTLQTTKFIALS